ncbi:MAG TPA: helix-turn-helix transcriptional regulator [Terriglobales bacterium]|nr:helix-turn-helix transcriptional regulator [Terriglobales bacterium]
MSNKTVFEADYFRVTVRVWRRAKQFTIADLSELTDISPQRLGVIENGGGAPTIAELSHLCEVMDESVTTFFKEKR